MFLDEKHKFPGEKHMFLGVKHKFLGWKHKMHGGVKKKVPLECRQVTARVPLGYKIDVFYQKTLSNLTFIYNDFRAFDQQSKILPLNRTLIIYL